MSIIAFKSFKILDRNSNDRFDGADQVLSKGELRPIAPESQEVREFLDQVGSPTLQALPSLYLASVHHSGLERFEGVANAGGLDWPFVDYQGFHRSLAKNLGLHWNDSQSASRETRNFLKKFSSAVAEAECWAQAPDVRRCEKLSSGEYFLMRHHQAELWLSVAKDLGQRESPEIALDAAWVTRIRDQALVANRRSLGEQLSLVPAKAKDPHWPLDALYEEAKQQIPASELSPLQKKILLEEAHWKEVQTRAKKTEMENKKRVERVRLGPWVQAGELLKLQNSQVWKELPPAEQDALLAQAVTRGAALLPIWASQGELGKLDYFQGQLEILSKAKSAMALPSLSSADLTRWRQQASSHYFKRLWTQAESAAKRGEVEAMDYILAEAQRTAIRPENLAAAMWDETAAQQLQAKGLVRSLEVLSLLLDAQARDGSIRLDQVSAFGRNLKRLGSFPGFEPFPFAKFQFSNSPIQLGAMYRWSMAAADWKSREAEIEQAEAGSLNASAYPPWVQDDIDSIDVLLRFAEACTRQAALGGRLIWEPTRAQEISARYLRAAVPRLFQFAVLSAPLGDVAEVESALKMALDVSQRPEVQSLGLFDAAKAEEVRQESLKKGIDGAFKEAERAAKERDREKAIVELEKTIDYSQRSGVPFDEVRYGKILALLQ